MADIIAKVDDSTISVTATKEEIATYDYDFLISQRDSITKDILRNQDELKKVNDLIAQAESLGVTSKQK